MTDEGEHAALPHDAAGQAMSVFSQREVAVLGKLAGLFGEDERLESLRELVRVWMTLNGFGWFGRVLMVGVVSLVSFVGAVAVIVHWLAGGFVGAPK